MPCGRTVWDVQVNALLADQAAGVEDTIRAVVRCSSRDANDGSKRENRRIGCNDAFRYGRAGCGDRARAVRRRGKQQWCGGARRRLCYGGWRMGLRRLDLRRLDLRRLDLRRLNLGRRTRMDAMRTGRKRQRSHHDECAPSAEREDPVHECGRGQTAIRTCRIRKSVGILIGTAKAPVSADEFRGPDHKTGFPP